MQLLLHIVYPPINFPRLVSSPHGVLSRQERRLYAFMSILSRMILRSGQSRGSPLTKRFRSAVVHGSAEAVIVGALLSRWHRSNCQKDTPRLITLSVRPAQLPGFCFFFFFRLMYFFLPSFQVVRSRKIERYKKKIAQTFAGNEFVSNTVRMEFPQKIRASAGLKRDTSRIPRTPVERVTRRLTASIRFKAANAERRHAQLRRNGIRVNSTSARRKTCRKTYAHATQSRRFR